MKRLTVLSALVLLLASLAPAAFADEAVEAEDEMTVFSAAQEWKAQLVAEYFTGFWADDEGTAEPAELADPAATYDPAIYEAVVALRTGDNETIGHAVGWGALYKLMLYIGPELLDGYEFEDGLAIGQLRKLYFENLGEDEPGIKNLGQLKKEQKAKDGWMPPGQKKKQG
ncbi:MAG: hypothetical protein ABFS21_02350 [Actinomycetota bacterium]